LLVFFFFLFAGSLTEYFGDLFLEECNVIVIKGQTGFILATIWSTVWIHGFLICIYSGDVHFSRSFLVITMIVRTRNLGQSPT